MSSGNSTILFRCFASFDKVEGTFAIGQRNVGFLVSHDDSKTFKFASNTIEKVKFISRETPAPGAYKVLVETSEGRSLIFDILGAEPPHHQKARAELVKECVDILLSVKPSTPDGGESRSGSDTSDSSSGSTSSADSDTLARLQSKKEGSIIVSHVSNPAADLAKDHVTYTVTTRTNLPSLLRSYPPEAVQPHDGCIELQVQHRFRDFEALYTKLSTTYPKASLPDLPSKSIWNRFNSEFLTARCKELDQFLQGVVSNPLLRDTPELINFFTHGEAEDMPGVAGGSPPTSPGVFGGYSPSAMLSKLANKMVDNPVFASAELKWTEMMKQPRPVFTSTVEADYWQVKQYMKAWDLTPKKLPFEKFVVLVLGTTSAGKSAFINHFLGLPVKKSADCQQDTAFTVIEVVTPEVFNHFAASVSARRRSSSNATSPRNHSASPTNGFHGSNNSNGIPHGAEFAAMLEGDEWQFDEGALKALRAPIMDTDSDVRHGKVFLYLNTTQTTARYEQLRQNENDGLFQAVLVNSKYITRSNPHYDLICRSILIDSPGFDSIQTSDIAEKFMGNLKILQYLYNMSDMLLYFIPSGQITQLSSQIPLLELSIIYATYGEEFMDHMIRDLYQRRGNNTPKQKGIYSVFADIADAVVKAKRSTSLGGGETPAYQGTSIWHKTFFVLSKVDAVLRSAALGGEEMRQRAISSQYYELGMLLGQALKRLSPPVMDQCLSIGLPEFQTNYNTAPYTGDLPLLLDKLSVRESQAPYVIRLEAAIQRMCAELEATINASWSKYSLGQVLNGGHLSAVRQLSQKSRDRLAIETKKDGASDFNSHRGK